MSSDQHRGEEYDVEEHSFFFHKSHFFKYLMQSETIFISYIKTLQVPFVKKVNVQTKREQV